MDLLQIVLRLVHIVLGAFWVGALIFNAYFLMPAMLEAGPDAMKVAAGLTRRRFLDVLPAVAALTLLSGLWLYWRVSLGFQPAYMGSAVGITYGLGALAALIGFVIGVVIVRRSMLKATALTQGAASAPDREAKLAQAGALRVRAAQTSKLIALLLIIAVAAMAVGRYV
jgi:uncharacterized membrane protein